MNSQVTSDHDLKFTRTSLIEVRKFNDLLRTTNLSIYGKTVLTVGVSRSEFREEIITAVREFNKFDNDNDPYGEHDSAIVYILDKNNQKICKARFKIDYYDLNLEFGVDPEEACIRVLIIMLAEEI